MSSEQAIQRALEKVSLIKADVLSVLPPETVRRYLHDLLAMPAEYRSDAIERSRSKYVSPQLAEALIKLSRDCAGNDPLRSEELSSLAEQVVLKAREKEAWRPFSIDLHALSVALQGNAHRIRGQYAEAQSLLERAHTILDHGSGDPVVFGDILSMDTSLLLDRYRHEEAEGTIRRAMRVFERCRESHRIGRALMLLAVVQEDAGRPGQAVESLRSALEHLDFEEEPRLKPRIYKDLGLLIAEAGDTQRGWEVLQENPLPDTADRRLRLKREWTEARIQSALGMHAEAAATLSVLREGFTRADDIICAAMVSLDLALAFAHQGFSSEVKRVAQESLSLLSGFDLPERVFAALILFQQAAEAEEATLSVLQSIQKTVADYRLWRKKVEEH